MKLKLLKLFVFSFALLGAYEASSQAKIIYSDSFSGGSTYCPGTTQYDGWGTFRAKLDTNSIRFKKVTAKGTYNNTGYTCTDPFITRKLAIALKNGTSYSATCDGNAWGTWGAGVCKSTGCSGSSSNQVELTVNGGSCSCGSTVSFNVC
ncbi:MAG: hypothetical protein H7321_09925, partial [Bacteroidia bacterium]|nr:hypothetical protein [Bacteroidia bacterium]